jgi:hypothetical protein
MQICCRAGFLEMAVQAFFNKLLDSYVDFTPAALAMYLCRSPNDLIANSSLAILNPALLFGPAVPVELAQRFWNMQTATMDEFAKVLSLECDLIPAQDFTAFRMKPFLRLDTGNVICINPGFIQEKLEVGLFWTIVNNLPAEGRSKAFETWGNLFETYINETLEFAVDKGKETFIPLPEFAEKKHRHEAFDRMLLSGPLCVVFECKGGFLPNKAKYAEDVDQFLASLDQKFGTASGAGVEQLARKIGQVFAADQKERRMLATADLSDVKIVVPALVVQDGFVSSFFTVPWLAKRFRSVLKNASTAASRNPARRRIRVFITFLCKADSVVRSETQPK